MDGKEMFKIFLVVITYWFVSISLVFANKFLVGGSADHNISLFVSWCQCFATFIFGGLISFIVGLFLPLSTSGWNTIMDIKYFSYEMTPVFKMSFCLVCMLAFNNMCLKLVGVSFYQVARSMTIIFVVILSVVILKKSVSRRVVLCCLLVASGFLLGVNQEGAMKDFSLVGVTYGVISSIFIALTGIYTKQALPVVCKNELKLTVWTNVTATLMFLPLLFIFGEHTRVFSSPRLWTTGFWACLTFSSFLGFALSWISAVQINVTSPVSHHISANSKAILQTILAVVYYEETKSVLWWFSVCLVIFGACAYAIQRYKEEKEADTKLPMHVREEDMKLSSTDKIDLPSTEERS